MHWQFALACSAARRAARLGSRQRPFDKQIKSRSSLTFRFRTLAIAGTRVHVDTLRYSMNISERAEIRLGMRRKSGNRIRFSGQDDTQEYMYGTCTGLECCITGAKGGLNI